MVSIGWLRASESSSERNATIQLDEQSRHKQCIWEKRETKHDARIVPGASADARLYHILRPRPAPETESGGCHPQKKKKSPTSQLPYLTHTCLCSVIYIVPLRLVEQANARYHPDQYYSLRFYDLLARRMHRDFSRRSLLLRPFFALPSLHLDTTSRFDFYFIVILD
jgi:hypothetical protein